jgi:hypothetical protein
MPETKTTAIREVEWVKSFVASLDARLKKKDLTLRAVAGKKLPYALEALQYFADDYAHVRQPNAFQTDLLICEHSGDTWKPRVIVEAKLRKLSTHDAITYSQKSATHKQVHPYLRYGILLGHRKHHALPGRLFRHGSHFDFMVSWPSEEPSSEELNRFVELLLEEVEASRLLEEIIYNTRALTRKRYSTLRKKLILQ